MFIFENEKRCIACGKSFSEYNIDMLLGCEYCYEEFKDLLEREIKEIHRANRHVGKRKPKSKSETLKKRLGYLNAKLNSGEVTRKEAYELSLEIEKLEKELR